MNKSYTYKLNYTIWDSKTNRSKLIQDDTVSYPDPMPHNLIKDAIEHRWQLLKGDNIQVGDMDIVIMSV